MVAQRQVVGVRSLQTKLTEIANATVVVTTAIGTETETTTRTTGTAKKRTKAHGTTIVADTMWIMILVAQSEIIVTARETETMAVIATGGTATATDTGHEGIMMLGTVIVAATGMERRGSTAIEMTATIVAILNEEARKGCRPTETGRTLATLSLTKEARKGNGERSAISDRSEKVLYSKILPDCITVDDKYIVAETEVRCRCGISKTEGGNTRRGGDLTLCS